MSPVLTADDVSVGYRPGRRRTTTVLSGVTAALHPGELVCLLGPNGVGKSTLLRTLIGSQAPLAGSVHLAGSDITTMSARDRACRLSVVLTDRIDVGLLTARSLVELGRAPRTGWFASLGVADHDVVDWALDAAGATPLAARQVHELSDGERQRVMIARALAQEPDVLVLDEPTAFLDLTRRVELIALLRRLTSTTGLAVLMSTHELELALRTADSIWLAHPDGTFRCGAPEDLAIGGHIASAYAGGDISFDHAAGTFVIPPDPTTARSTISVSGDAPATTWATRAVQRSGWAVADGNGNGDGDGNDDGDDHLIPHVHVHLDDGAGVTGIRWMLRAPSGPDVDGDSLGALVRHLRSLDDSRAGTSSQPTTQLEAHP